MLSRGSMQTVDADRRTIGPGTRIRQYELIRELGRGGMGAVFLARDTRLGRRVAVKVVVAEERALIDGFLREARATAACHHENIVVIHEVDEHEGQPYMVLEYLEGQTLRTFMQGRRLSPQRTIDLMVPVLRALVCAHEKKIVHRDLKPENILVTSTGLLKVLDFGLAGMFGNAAAESAAPRSSFGISPADSDGENDDVGDTRPIRFGGTPAYLAPELHDGGDADAGVDLWAVGVMLYEMLAGHHPVEPLTAPALARSAQALDEPMPGFADEVEVPRRLAELVARCLEKRRERRIGSAREVLEELEALRPSRPHRAADEHATPFPGLVAFQESEADRFFGRTRETLHVLAQLREHPLLGVIGPSGVGKSSFVRAGVVPALRSSGERWEAIVLRPGRQPLHSMATILQPLTTTQLSIHDKMIEHDEMVARLRHEPGYLGAVLRSRAGQRHTKILLFVDQLEELYTLVPDAAERQAFIACLAGVADDAATPLRVLVSLRSDFLDRVGEDRRFADELARGLVLLQPLGRDALREALETPIAQLGHSFENPEIVGEMVEALASTPGALPLLQFAGAKLWEARDRRRKLVTVESYRALGGIIGVLAQHADEVVHALPAPRQRLARNLFQRLVTAEGTRAIVELAELADLAPDPNEVRTLVDQLVAARLLVVQSRGTSEGATVELVHESLLTRWPLLRRWLDEGRDDLAFREQLRAAARQWDARGRQRGLLWTGEAMEEARLWRARHQDRLPPKEAAYLQAVFLAATRAQRLRRGLVSATIAALVAVIAGGSVALVRIQRAEQRAVDQAAVARDQAEKARAAESQVKEKLEVVRREQEAKARAEEEVRRGREHLSVVNGELEVAIAEAQTESRRARSSARDAQRLAGSLKAANQSLETLLADARARAEKLERERRKIAGELR